MRTKAAGIVLEMAQYTKSGRLSQYVEPISEAAQLLEANGWKRGKTILLAEVLPSERPWPEFDSSEGV